MRIEIYVAIILSIVVFGCSDTEYYKVQFDDVNRLKEGDKVFLKGLEVGEVKDLQLNDNKKILATIWVGRDIKLTSGSTFTIHAELFGSRYIQIELADTPKLMNAEEVQEGYLQPPDTTGSKKLTPAELDSLVKHHPVFGLADTVLRIIRNSRDSTRVMQ